MGDSIRVETRKIEHIAYGATKIPVWAVTFAVDLGDYESRTTVHVLGFSDKDIASVDAEARKELHRISSALAAEAPGSAPSTIERTPEAPGAQREGRTLSQMGADQDARRPRGYSD